MSPTPRDQGYLRDMLVRARLVVGASPGLTLADLDSMTVMGAAVERWIEIIGETARSISNDFKAAHPNIPWSKIVVTRHILAHEDDDIDHEIIFDVVKTHIPILIEQSELILLNAPPDPQPEGGP